MFGVHELRLLQVQLKSFLAYKEKLGISKIYIDLILFYASKDNLIIGFNI